MKRMAALILFVVLAGCILNNGEKKDEPKPTEAPIAPSDLKAISDMPESILITWTDNSDNEAGFIIEVRDKTAITPVYIDSTTKNLTSYRINELDEFKSYFCYLKAYNIIGESEYIEPVSVTVSPEYPVLYKIVKFMSNYQTNTVKYGYGIQRGYIKVYKENVEIYCKYYYTRNEYSGVFPYKLIRTTTGEDEFAEILNLPRYTISYGIKSFIMSDNSFNKYIEGERVYSEIYIQ